jgi:hypothetical protein
VEWLRLGDLLAALAGQAPSKRIAKECVGTLGLARAMDSSPAGGVGDVADYLFVIAHSLKQYTLMQSG